MTLMEKAFFTERPPSLSARRQNEREREREASELVLSKAALREVTRFLIDSRSDHNPTTAGSSLREGSKRCLTTERKVALAHKRKNKCTVN
jgi:hypothetical protein